MVAATPVMSATHLSFLIQRAVFNNLISYAGMFDPRITLEDHKVLLFLCMMSDGSTDAGWLVPTPGKT